VPQPLWGISGHKLLKSAWARRIRPQVVAEAEGRCTCCGGKTKLMFAHEEWDYDDSSGVATVTGLTLICQDCNSVTHFGRLPSEYDEQALQHLASVNGIKREEAETLRREAFGVWARRSAREWTVEVSPEVVARYPDMGDLPERARAALEAGEGVGRRGSVPEERDVARWVAVQKNATR
jgi:hypothetical protein